MADQNGFERDIFISYAHLDNEGLTEEEQGWITAFDKALQKRLGQLLGRTPDIWRDRKLQGNDIFGDEIVDQFPRLKILVSVISPRYLESEWCRKELNEFYEVAQQSGGVRVENKSRIFKVIKTPVPYEVHPPEIKSVLGYEFFQEDENGRFREFNLEKGSPTYYQFIERFEDVAQDLCQLIKMLEAGAQPSGEAVSAGSETATPEKTIYLAKTTSDLDQERDNIRRDLEERGYTILPDQELPLDERFREAVAGYLARCKVAVHLVGSKYGLVPEDEQHSLVELQHELSQEATLTRLIWMPADLSSEDERQQHFLAALQDYAVAQQGTELLIGALEDFKTEIIDTMEKLAAPAKTPPPPEDDDAPPRVYLMVDEADRDAATEIDDYLYDQGFEVLLPVFDGDENDIRALHQDNLRVCDAVLIYFNQASEPWITFKMNDLRKAPGYGRSKPLRTSAVYLAGEKNRFKERFRSREADTIIKQFEAFSEADLAPFIESLRSSGA